METGMETAKPVTPVEELSLQAHLDQIEAAIDVAHRYIDDIHPRAGDRAETAPADGAQAAAQRCQGKLGELNQRLTSVSQLVGLV